MDKNLLAFAKSLPLQKERLLNELKSYVEQNGLRPTARTLNVQHSNLSRACNGGSVSIETLAEYVIILFDI